MSQPMTKADIPHLAVALVSLGQKLGQVGEQAWHAALDYAPGPKAHNTDSDAGGWRYDAEGEPIPNDIVGEAATTHDPTSLLHHRYQALLAQLQLDTGDLQRLLGTLVPHPPGVTVTGCKSCGALRPGKGRTINPDDVAADGWCRSCFRLDGLLEPIGTDRNGTPYYATYCRWCGGFRSEHGCEPPLALLQIRHRHGRRVSLADVERECPHCQTQASRKAS